MCFTNNDMNPGSIDLLSTEFLGRFCKERKVITMTTEGGPPQGSRQCFTPLRSNISPQKYFPKPWIKIKVLNSPKCGFPWLFLSKLNRGNCTFDPNLEVRIIRGGATCGCAEQVGGCQSFVEVVFLSIKAGFVGKKCSPELSNYWMKTR